MYILQAYPPPPPLPIWNRDTSPKIIVVVHLIYSSLTKRAHEYNVVLPYIGIELGGEPS